MEACKDVAVSLFFICLVLSNCVSEEITAESVYKLLSHSIFEIKVDIQNMNRRIENIEQKVQGITTTVSPLVENTTKEEFYDFKEQLNLKAMAIQKSLTKEKVLLRETVEKFEIRFDEFKSEIQKDMASINATLEGKAQEMFDIVNNSSNALAKGISEMTSNFNHTTENISQFLETMEITMMSNFENIETRMIANVSEIQRETEASLRSLQKGIDSLSANVSSVSSFLSDKISSESSSLSSRINSVSSSLSSSISSVSSSLSSRISSETYSLSSRISSLSSSISSLSSSISSHASSISSLSSSISSHYSSISSLSSSISSHSSSISSLSTRISREEDRKVAFSATMGTADSYYYKGETINEFISNYNYGGGYNAYTGVFTAPKSGTYLFSVTIASENNELVIVNINAGGLYAYAVAGDESNATGSATCVVYLSYGETAYVQTSHNNEDDKIRIRSTYGNFAGVLID